jgi:hypothetical protein
MGKNPGGVAFGYEKRIEYDGNGERIKACSRSCRGKPPLSFGSLKSSRPASHRARSSVA